MSTTNDWSFVGHAAVSVCLALFGVAMVLASSVVVATMVGTTWLCLHSCKFCVLRLWHKLGRT